MAPYELARWFGIVAFVFMFIAAALGYFKFKFRQRFLLHKVFGLLAVLFAVIHVAIVIFATYG